MALFANILSQSIGCLFILFTVSFALQNLLSLIRSHLFIFVSITLGDRSKKNCCSLYPRVFCLCFSLAVIEHLVLLLGFPSGSGGKESDCDVRGLGSVLGLGRSPGGGHATHSSILAWRIPTDRGAWQATVHGVTKSQI